jgi:hypothetical protein
MALLRSLTSPVISPAQPTGGAFRDRGGAARAARLRYELGSGRVWRAALRLRRARRLLHRAFSYDGPRRAHLQRRLRWLSEHRWNPCAPRSRAGELPVIAAITCVRRAAAPSTTPRLSDKIDFIREAMGSAGPYQVFGGPDCTPRRSSGLDARRSIPTRSGGEPRPAEKQPLLLTWRATGRCTT